MKKKILILTLSVLLLMGFSVIVASAAPSNDPYENGKYFSGELATSDLKLICEAAYAQSLLAFSSGLRNPSTNICSPCQPLFVYHYIYNGNHYYRLLVAVSTTNVVPNVSLESGWGFMGATITFNTSSKFYLEYYDYSPGHGLVYSTTGSTYNDQENNHNIQDKISKKY